MAGFYETGSNKLYIANSSTTTPLIYGDFATSRLRINGTLQLSGATGPGYVLTDISGNGNLSLQPQSSGIPSYSQSIKTDSLNVGITADYADNASAIAAGLVAGDVYRTGDILKVVH